MAHRILDHVQCIVFDIDDTLYLERDYAKSGFEAVGEWAKDELGLDDFAERAWAKFEQGVRRTIFNEVFDEAGVDYDRELIKQMVGVYRGHEPDIELLPDAARCIDALANDFQLAALTGGPIVCQKAKVRALGLDDLLEPIVYARQWGADFDKPHPRSFEELEAHTGFSGEELVYLADNPHKDFTAPREMGWKTVRVRRAGSLHEGRDSEVAVDVEVSKLSPLLSELPELA
jgi:putative hydrolase of the HAD superfamily